MPVGAAEGGDGAHDPHVWFDVQLWMSCVDVIRDELIALDPPPTVVRQPAYEVGREAMELLLKRIIGLPGDVVELTERARGHLRVKAALEAAESRGFPEWLEVDAKAGKGTFKAYPVRSELPPTINEGLVVELYSR